jgi:uncharacterized protein DUF5753/helix-turn-helix protein
MADREPTIRSRELGEGLRVAMENAGLSGVEAARILGWSPGWVSRLLTGKRGCRDTEIAHFLGVCRVDAKEAERLMALAQEQDTPGWLQQYGAGMTKRLRTLIDHETQAAKINCFECLVVPGLLQTAEYARAVFNAVANVTASQIEDRLATRMARQTLLSRTWPPRFIYFLHEFVLRTPVGGPAVMSDQLHQLLRLSVRPHITLRVVPVETGAHAAMHGAFQLMEFNNFRPVVYMDSETTSLFLEKPDETTAYRDVLTALAETALGEGQSREIISTIATDLYKDHDEPARTGYPRLVQE